MAILRAPSEPSSREIFRRHGHLVLGSPSRQVGLAILQGTRQVELGVDSLDTMRRVDVLDHGDLKARGGTLARRDGRVAEEILPNLRKQWSAIMATESQRLSS